MRKILVIAYSLFCSISVATAQNNIVQDQCRQLPMKAGTINYSAATSKGQSSNSFLISSSQGEVYALTSGKVAAIVPFPGKDYKAVGIAYLNDTVMEYTMLRDVAVKQGNMISKGDLIGKATINPKTNKNEAAIVIKVFSKAIRLTDPQVMAFVKRVDN